MHITMKIFYLCICTCMCTQAPVGMYKCMWDRDGMCSILSMPKCARVHAWVCLQKRQRANVCVYVSVTACACIQVEWVRVECTQVECKCVQVKWRALKLGASAFELNAFESSVFEWECVRLRVFQSNVHAFEVMQVWECEYVIVWVRASVWECEHVRVWVRECKYVRVWVRASASACECEWVWVSACACNRVYVHTSMCVCMRRCAGMLYEV